MCYGMNCGYEDYNGDCSKTGRLPCPLDEEDMDAYYRAEDAKMERFLEELREVERAGASYN